MDARRERLGAAIIVASVWSAVSAALVVALDATGAAPRALLVLSVIVIGFVTSWVQSGRIDLARPHEPIP